MDTFIIDLFIIFTGQAVFTNYAQGKKLQVEGGGGIYKGEHMYK